jgi:hypothetical protein
MRELRAVALVAAVGGAMVGCADANAPDGVALTPSVLVGTWTDQLVTPQGYTGCVFAVTFSDDGTFGAGTVCTAAVDHQADVDWTTGSFTAAPSGRINFLGSAGYGCTWGPVGFGYGEYSGTGSRPHITIAPSSQGVVLAPSTAPPFPESAVFGCFDSAWTFTPAPVP